MLHCVLPILAIFPHPCLLWNLLVAFSTSGLVEVDNTVYSVPFHFLVVIMKPADLLSFE